MPRDLRSPLGPAIDSFLRARWDLKPNTLTTYRMALLRFARLHETLADLTAENVNGYLAAVADHPAMARNEAIALRQFSGWATKSRIFAHDPLASVSLPRGSAHRRTPFTDAEIHAIIETALRSPHGVRDQAIVITALATGLRPAELCAIELDDLDLKAGFIRVRLETTKSAAGERVVPLDPQAVAALDAYIRDERAARPGRLWLNARGDPLTLWGFMGVWHRIRDRLRADGLPGIQAYRARHTAITDWVRVGIPAPIVQQLAGHASFGTTQRYIGRIGTRDLAQLPRAFTQLHGRMAS